MIRCAGEWTILFTTSSYTGVGFYGFGLTHMIGGLSRGATSILRQLIDAGTLSNLPAGFKARGIRIRERRCAYPAR